MGVTDDYIVLFDYLQGERPHRYDSLLQIKGFKELAGDSVEKVRHTSQWTENPLSDAQFITDCDWYEVKGPSKASFETIYGEGEDMRGTRSHYNTSGVLKLDVHTAWPRQSEQIVGRAAEDHGYAIPMEYGVEVDGIVQASGRFGAWILGEGRCGAMLEGAKTLRLRVKQYPKYNENRYPYKSKQGLFWGEAYIVTKGGSKRKLSELNAVYENIDPGFGVGMDYEGGRVTIVGNEYPGAIPTSPVDHDAEGVITLDLQGLDAVRFIGLIGADAFGGDEAQRRKTYSVRTQGMTARYITVLEPYEANGMVVSVQAADENTLEVRLADGRLQRITVDGMEREAVSLKLVENKEGRVIREELAR